ncbi:putative autophagy-related protein 3 atg3 [Cardiosporidium cionae]|uniref:Autophagy-related protein 3 atg3 n=1 Tax=Cardiosporidium cionae TaxID=476202 RepID=A0ABQ7J4I9_9APIC|nr:putative autophagy-related protein 3 atg3 [Cardiosporidium cionae]|eukprot:KAF8817979.1 putative autophagy-related protein 3 atg3 [Cardiosporidium cionae]
MNVGHRIADGMRNVFAYLTPIPKESQFVDRGVLTPIEFVEAGDQLVFRCPTWQWQAAEYRYSVNWLPKGKQYLITRNVPCKFRVKDLEKAHDGNMPIEPDGDWLLPGVVEEIPAEDMLQQGMDMSSLEAEDETKAVLKLREDYVKQDPEEDALDMNTFEDVDSLLQKEVDPASAETNSSYFIRQEPDINMVQTRTYDLSITYDKYYQTPRLWLFGYNENGIPLTPIQIFEDILTHYVSKTVTVDPHPCSGIPTASIHPCKHAEVMKRVIKSWKEKDMDLRPHLAIFILLKFIASVIPTIDYDFTMDIEMQNSRSEGSSESRALRKKSWQ